MEESDEGSFWIDRLFDAKPPANLHVQSRTLQGQFEQITRMTVASLKTSRLRLRSEQERRKRERWHVARSP